MAQFPSEPGNRRYGFQYLNDISHQYGKISAITSTPSGNFIICDSSKKELVLMDKNGYVENTISLDGQPEDITISQKTNRAYVTVPTRRSVLEIDPDRLTIRSVHDSKKIVNVAFTILSVLDLPDFIFNLVTDGFDCHLSTIRRFNMISYNSFFETTRMNNCTRMRSNNHSVYFNTLGKDYIYKCFLQTFHKIERDFPSETSINIPSLDVGTDIAFDDNGHIYVTGLYSDNIIRITEDGETLDVPLTGQHGIRRPTALCFSNDYSKLYVANEWGRSVKMYNVV